MMRPKWLLLTTGMFLAALGALEASKTFGATGILVRVDRSPVSASLQGLNAKGTLAFSVASARRNVAVDQLVRWGALANPGVRPQVVLADGSLLTVDPYGPMKIDDEHLSFQSEVFGAVLVPLLSVRGFLLQPPTDTTRRDRWLAQIEDAESTADTVVLVNGDRMRGMLSEWRDDRLQLTTTDRKVSVPVDQVVGIIMNAKLVQSVKKRSGLRMRVGLRDGSRLIAVAWSSEAGRVRFTLASGLQLSTKVGPIVLLQPLGSTVTYLSDLKMASYRHRPYLDLTWPLRIDRNVTNGRLRAEGVEYDKGLGMHSTAGLTYRLDKPYRRFEASVAIDDSTDGRGSVIVRVYLDDGNGKWKPAFTSKTIRGGQKPVRLSVDITGAKRLSLIVDAADRGDEQDHVNWLDARLVP